jgi:hypothetical protein
VLTMYCVQLLTRGFTWRRGVIAAVALAAAYLSKILAIALVAPLALALLEARAVSRGTRSGPAGERTQDTPSSPATKDGRTGTETRVPMLARVLRLSVLLVTLAIVLPWTLRNLRLYGDLTAQHAMRSAVSHLITDRSLWSVYFLWDFPLLLFASFVGLFGWANVVLPKWIYLLFIAFGLVAAAGVVRGWYVRAIDRRVLRMLVLLIASALAVVVYINLMFTQPQGRYMLPALPAIALVVALGLTHLPGMTGPRPLVFAAAALFLFNIWCLAGVIVPAYWPPLVRTTAPGVRVAYPVSVHDLVFIPRPVAATGANLRFDLMGKDPSLLVPLDIDASAYDTIELELAGRVPGSTDVAGAIIFATENQGLSLRQRMEFRWRADDTIHVVRVPIGEHPHWRGVITHIRVDPIEEEAVPPDENRAPPVAAASTADRGRIEIGGIRLRGPGGARMTRD